MRDYGVVTVSGNSEFYNTLGLDSFPYVQGSRVESQEWTRRKLGDVRVKAMEIYPSSIDLILGGKRLALCHFINDIRWDFDNSHNVHTYRLIIRLVKVLYNFYILIVVKQKIKFLML